MSEPGSGERPATWVLAGRIAMDLVNRDPGWQLPLPSALARRHGVCVDEVHAAVDQLVSQQLVRRSPDGRLYRSSPADYRIWMPGMAGLAASVDPMGGNLTCLSYTASQRPASEDAACALGVPPGEHIGVIRLVWALNGTPAAVSTTYLTGLLDDPHPLAEWLSAAELRGEQPRILPGGQDGSARRPAALGLRPQAAGVQMELPPTSVAKRLRLKAGQMAVLVTVLLGDGSRHQMTAFTAAVLRPDMFRITVQAPPPATVADPAAGSPPVPGSPPADWSLAVGDDGP